MRSFASEISFPSAYAVLMLVILLEAMTWVLPAGRYDLTASRSGASHFRGGTRGWRRNFVR
jgi:uncharacterized ion transporter superfamily protein YfcC